jgi:phosphopentomutase
VFNRVIITVLDSAGIGALPDAAEFGDEGSNTIGNIYKARGRLEIPNLYTLGLGNIESACLPSAESPLAAYGRMAEITKAKDTTSGHWELAGLIMDTPFRTFPDGFPDGLLREWLTRAGRKPAWLGNEVASGTEIMARLGAKHVRTGAPVVYTSADSVFQVAAHESVIPLDELYKLCEIAREVLNGEYNVGRVIARPFAGESGAFRRTENRRDYAVPPPGDTILDALEKQGLTTLGIGKIEDIFCKRGVAHVNHTTNNRDGIDATLDALRNNRSDALIFTNLVDFDMLYGHRNDTEGYAKALEYFDSQLPRVMEALRENDLLIITADHGCDPTTPSTDHSREYVPLLVYGKKVKPVSLGTRESFADLGATVYEILTRSAQAYKGAWNAGKSFLNQL